MEGLSMQVRMVILPSDNGLNVVVWGTWAAGSMRVKHFENRTDMVASLESVGLISPKDVPELESFTFVDSCPLFSADIEEENLSAHGFELA
jgi:hypothetical protein